MARMSVDDSVERDPRITKLSKLVGWTRRETLGCLVGSVWPIAYDQKTPTISADLVDLAAGADGFAAAMVAAELARWVRGNRKVRVAGAEERLKYLADKSTAGRVGGLKSAETRSKNPSSTAPAAQAERNPPVPDVVPVPDPVLPPDPVPDKAPVPEEEGDSPAARAPRVPSGPHQQAIAEFHGYYQRTHDGAKPTWPGKNSKLMASLVKAQGLHEIVRRIAILERSPPDFPPTPWDMATFAQHFDRIAQAPTRKLTPLEAQMERVRTLEAEAKAGA